MTTNQIKVHADVDEREFYAECLVDDTTIYTGPTRSNHVQALTDGVVAMTVKRKTKVRHLIKFIKQARRGEFGPLA